MWAKNGWTLVANKIMKAYGKAGNGEYLIRMLGILVNIWISVFLSQRKQSFMMKSRVLCFNEIQLYKSYFIIIKSLGYFSEVNIIKTNTIAKTLKYMNSLDIYFSLVFDRVAQCDNFSYYQDKKNPT